MNGERAFPNTSQSIARARRYALENIEGITSELADRVALMVSELATNAVRHAASSFTVSIERQAGSIRVAVTDAGHGTPTVQSPAPTDYSGRGLLIVRSLADSWGVTETSGGSGKTVWFVLDLDTQTSATGTEDGREIPQSRQQTRKPSLSPRAGRESRESRRGPSACASRPLAPSRRGPSALRLLRPSSSSTRWTKRSGGARSAWTGQISD